MAIFSLAILLPFCFGAILGAPINVDDVYCFMNKDHNNKIWSECMFNVFAFNLFVDVSDKFREENCRLWEDVKQCVENAGGFCANQENVGPGLYNFIDQLCYSNEDFDLFWPLFQRIQKLDTKDVNEIDRNIFSCTEDVGVDKPEFDKCFFGKNPCEQGMIDSTYRCMLLLADLLPYDIDKIDLIIQKFIGYFGYKKIVMVNYKNHCSLTSRRNMQKLTKCFQNEVGFVDTPKIIKLPFLEIKDKICGLLEKFEDCLVKEGGLEEYMHCSVYDRSGPGSYKLVKHYCSNEDDLKAMITIAQNNITTARDVDWVCTTEENYDRTKFLDCLAGRGFCDQSLTDASHRCTIERARQYNKDFMKEVIQISLAELKASGFEVNTEL